MSKYYLRLEAVNLDNFVEDTQDLSTIRGGSLLLLSAVEDLKIDLPRVRDLKEVTTGASVGLYEFEMADAPQTTPGLTPEQEVRVQVEDQLRRKDGLRYATIVVDVRRKGPQFAEDLQALTARNRWRQMKSLSVALDPQPSDGPCEVDKVRPAVKQTRIHNQDRWVSRAVFDRREHGKEMKQEIYQEEIRRLRNVKTGRVVLAQFVHDLEELASDPKKGNLHGKIAVIHLDGNRFGRIKEHAGDSREVWEEFDRTVKTYRRQMLDSLLDAMSSDADWQTDEGRYRIEMLLWGGDEIIWVVPAWKGWETLSRFYDSSQSWEFTNDPLRHAGGIIFCHHNAPIHRLTRLAHDLSDRAKEGDGRDHNRFAYEVLESFDHVGSDFDAYRQAHCVQPLEPGVHPDTQQLNLDARDMLFLQQQAKTLSEKLPRRKLHEVVEGLLTPFEALEGEADGARVERMNLQKERRAATIRNFKVRLNKAGVSDTQVQQFEQQFGGAACWLHLQALWDYLI
jgi:hypothetical protein